MPWANQTLWPCTYTHTLTGDAAALQKTRSRLCWCLVCNCVCVCLRRGTRRRAHRESNAPARQCGAARPVTLGHPAGSLGTTSTLRDLQSFTRFHLQTYESGERGSGGKKKKGFLSSPARQSLDHVDVGPASSSSSCEAIRWRTRGRGPGCRRVWLGALGAGWWGRGGWGHQPVRLCLTHFTNTQRKTRFHLYVSCGLRVCVHSGTGGGERKRKRRSVWECERYGVKLRHVKGAKSECHCEKLGHATKGLW